MKKCEYCSTPHDGDYGSSRFCSKKCASGFSTKAKRKEINKKVSEKLKKTSNKILIGEGKEKICECGTRFIYYKNKKYCSISCTNKYPQLGKPKKKGNERKKGSGGLRPGGGKSKQYPYTNWLGYKMSLNKEEIKVAKVLDTKKLNWDRNRKGFPYITQEGKPRKFYPDFVIDENKYIEYKGWITEEMDWKMKDATKKNNLDLTIIVGKDKRYKDFGVNLKEFESKTFIGR